MLEGKQFTTVHCYEFKQYEPEVRLHQKLEGGRNGDNIKVIHHHEKPDGDPNHPHSQLILCDTYGVGGLSTTNTEEGYDPEFKSPYVVFDWKQIRITDRAPNGLLYYTVIAVE